MENRNTKTSSQNAKTTSQYDKTDAKHAVTNSVNGKSTNAAKNGAKNCTSTKGTK